LNFIFQDDSKRAYLVCSFLKASVDSGPHTVKNSFRQHFADNENKHNSLRAITVLVSPFFDSFEIVVWNFFLLADYLD
jgi:hypothetical protein